MCSRTLTVCNMQKHTTNTLVHMLMHYTYLIVCTHACMKAGAYEFPYVHAGMTEHTAHVHLQWAPRVQAAYGEPDPVILCLFCTSVIVILPTAGCLPCHMKVTVTCSYWADIIHEQQSPSPFNYFSPSPCLPARLSCLFISVLATFSKEWFGSTSQMLSHPVFRLHLFV